VPPGCNDRRGWAIAQRFDGQTFFFYAPKCRHQLQDAGGGAHPVFVLVVVVFVWLIDRLFQLSPAAVVDRKSYSRWSLSPCFLFVTFLFSSLFGSTRNAKVSLSFHACAGITFIFIMYYRFFFLLIIQILLFIIFWGTHWFFWKTGRYIRDRVAFKCH